MTAPRVRTIGQEFEGQTASAEPDLFTISEIAEQVGVSEKTIRFYEEKGLIKPARLGGQRVFTRADRGRIRIIVRSSQQIGLSLHQIGKYLEAYDASADELDAIKTLYRYTYGFLEDFQKRRAALDEGIRGLDQILTFAVERLQENGVTQEEFEELDRTAEAPARARTGRKPKDAKPAGTEPDG
ncbi:MerR family transcriptional regulator [Mameliella sediminis]|uniref:MerR family transcriptional regulator n=1 Tax=Mameliella sediminis TaxID=2836866 RepID=UPI001C48C99C|nr:MerR family transcriptional regulator [Mameliella sediminis]MBV7397259.1 MerR family transcriptional regulator [Mameliella sediminis]MBY6163846.1 MerR family transcriptional regulator [Mameliella alba]MBY6172257.1 MerR family transcriptional regulator [Mameliella alba]MBY6177333.1 MerR family transcriptional regulator [Mameliella alba]